MSLVRREKGAPMGFSSTEVGGLGAGEGGEGGGGGASMGGNAAAAGPAESVRNVNGGVAPPVAHVSRRHVWLDAVAYTVADAILVADHVTFCLAMRAVLPHDVIWAYATLADTPSVIHMAVFVIVTAEAVHDVAPPLAETQNLPLASYRMDTLDPLDSTSVATVQGAEMPESRVYTNPTDQGVFHPHVEERLPPGSRQTDPFWICA